MHHACTTTLVSSPEFQRLISLSFISIENASISTRHGFIKHTQKKDVTSFSDSLLEITYPAALAGAVVVAGTSAGAGAWAAVVGAGARHFQWNFSNLFCKISVSNLHILFAMEMKALLI
jgi:hypothetical protein